MAHHLRRDAATPASPTDTVGSRGPASRRTSLDSSMFSFTKRKRSSFKKTFSNLGGKSAENHHISVLKAAVGEIAIESLAGRDGASSMVFGPLSSFSGQVNLKMKKSMNIAVWIVFRGATEIKGRRHCFLDVKEKLVEAELSAHGHSFIFCLRIPGLNLPPSSAKPLIHYSFTAYACAPSDAKEDDILELDGIPSKELPIQFVPLVDAVPFEVPEDPESAANRPLPGDPGAEEKKRPASPKKDVNEKEKEKEPADPTSPATPATPSRPTLRLDTSTLAPSVTSEESLDHVPPLRQIRPRIVTTVDENSKPITHLQVSLKKIRFLPNGTVPLKLSLAIYRPRIAAKHFDVAIIERRWIERRAAGMAVGEIVSEVTSRVISERRLHLPLLPAELYDKKDKSGQESKTPATISEDSIEDDAVPVARYEEQIKADIPDFKGFVTDTLLPSCSLPLGPARPIHTLLSASSKGKSRAAAYDPSQVINDLYFTVSHSIKLSVALPAVGATTTTAKPIPAISTQTPSKPAPTTTTAAHAPSILHFNPFAPKQKPQVVTLPIYIGNKTAALSAPRFKITPPESTVIRSATPPPLIIPSFRLDPAEPISDSETKDKGKGKAPADAPDPLTIVVPGSGPNSPPTLAPLLTRQRTSSTASNLSALSALSSYTAGSASGSSSLAVNPGSNTNGGGMVRKRSVGWKDGVGGSGGGSGGGGGNGTFLTLASVGAGARGVRFVDGEDEF